jgi:hypothetical protein
MVSFISGFLLDWHGGPVAQVVPVSAKSRARRLTGVDKDTVRPLGADLRWIGSSMPLQLASGICAFLVFFCLEDCFD